MDQLSQIINQLALRAVVLYSGKFCGLTHFDKANATEGHIHLLRNGSLSLVNAQKEKIHLNQPAIIFVPKPQSHSLAAEMDEQAELICAKVIYAADNANLLLGALPDMMVLSMADTPFLQANMDWLLSEGAHPKEGQQAIMNRLMEIFIIDMLRTFIENEGVSENMLAGLSHPQLKGLLQQIHQSPGEPWSLEKMAETALMSRSKFAKLFKDVTGQTPNDYLLSWRISVAQTLLLKGKSVSLAANSMGYDTASAFSRAFRKKCQLSPKEWLHKQQVSSCHK